MEPQNGLTGCCESNAPHRLTAPFAPFAPFVQAAAAARRYFAAHPDPVFGWLAISNKKERGQ